jgi:cation diffusion facilitator CzcD-associated flavoprotein CzcO
LDVIIVGAGLSGIGAAYHLQTNCPNRTYAILEGRESLGGTWDLFRYPGIRSDSDMHTLGYSFRPWTNPKAIADGPSILAYLKETAREYGIDRSIRYRHRVERARWSTKDARWTVDVRDTASGSVLQFICGFLFVCAGYYDYEAGYTPEFSGLERFRGRVEHPQRWTPDIEYEGKRVVVIGSGATAVTLVPELAKRAAHVTMLQRSPTYVVSAPDRDHISEWARQRFSPRSAYALTRWKNVLLGMVFYAFCRSRPQLAKRMLIGHMRRQLPDNVDIAHFTPSYMPWDQRVCLVPNGDLFDAIREGRASVVTGQIDSFVEDGIRLCSGQVVEADLVVTATGLRLKLLGGLEFEVDGARIDLSKTMTYKGMMCSDVPNMAFAIGYTNASWTLKCDLTSQYVCRLLRHMDEHAYTQCCPRRNDPSVKEEPILTFSSGYIQRSVHEWPRQGSRRPWRLYQNYALDRVLLRHAPVDDPVMEFSTPNG